MSRPVDTQKVFRNQETRLLATAFGGLNVFFGVLMLFMERSWIGLEIALILVGLGVTLLVRWRRQGIYVNEEGLVIRGGFTTREVHWDHIDRFELQEVNYQAAPVTFVRLVDGSSVPARALYGGRLPSMDRRAQAQIDQLNVLARQYRSRSCAE